MDDEALRSVPPLAKGGRRDLKAKVRRRPMEIPPGPPFSKGGAIAAIAHDYDLARANDP